MCGGASVPVPVCMCVVAGESSRGTEPGVGLSREGVLPGSGDPLGPLCQAFHPREGCAPPHAPPHPLSALRGREGEDPVPLTWLRNPSPEETHQAAGWMTPAALSGLPRGLCPAPFLCRTCSGLPASTSASSYPTSPCTAFLGRCSSSWLSGMAPLGTAGRGRARAAGDPDHSPARPHR